MISAPIALASAEVLTLPSHSPRAETALAGLATAIAVDGRSVTTSRSYTGGSDLLIVWGPGGLDRVFPMRRQQQAGGRVVCLDLAYWHRERKVRVSIDAPHPQAWVLRQTWPADRVLADRIPMTNLWDPKGPVLIAGIGDKARAQYGAEVDAWQQTMRVEAKRRGYTVKDRPKRAAQVTPIESALRGVALVVTWHSNVAVDAIRAGIPVICRDGAAAAVCPSTWPEELQPLDRATRDRFLSNLAWFQWDMGTEAAACWTWLQELLS